MAKVQNKKILESIKQATEEYNKSLSSIIHETAGMNISDEAELSIRENVDENLEQRIEEIRESIEETPPPKIRIPEPNVREVGPFSTDLQTYRIHSGCFPCTTALSPPPKLQASGSYQGKCLRLMFTPVKGGQGGDSLVDSSPW